MAWDTFVYDNIKKQLVKEGFSEALAQGGHHTGPTFTGESRRRAGRR
ncbi:TPA: hypothetical protein ACX37U_000631 [Serratia marcescens]